MPDKNTVAISQQEFDYAAEMYLKLNPIANKLKGQAEKLNKKIKQYMDNGQKLTFDNGTLELNENDKKPIIVLESFIELVKSGKLSLEEIKDNFNISLSATGKNNINLISSCVAYDKATATLNSFPKETIAAIDYEKRGFFKKLIKALT
ncbi:MAG: hypothetical protein GY756_14400 [bacterium]|nr:hypothetical protein [bacterium]